MELGDGQGKKPKTWNFFICGLGLPSSGVLQNVEFLNKNLESGIKKLESGIQNLESGIQDYIY